MQTTRTSVDIYPKSSQEDFLRPEEDALITLKVCFKGTKKTIKQNTGITAVLKKSSGERNDS